MLFFLQNKVCKTSLLLLQTTLPDSTLLSPNLIQATTLHPAQTSTFLKQTKQIPITNSLTVELLLQRNELRRVSSTNTRPVVLHRLVSQRELAQVVTNHLGLDFNVVETLSVVHTHHGANHLGNHDHVTKVGLHGLRTLILGSVRLLHTHFTRQTIYSNTQSLHQGLRLSLQTTAETTASTGLNVQNHSQHLHQQAPSDPSRACPTTYPGPRHGK